MSQTALASAVRRRTKTEYVANTTKGNIPIPQKKEDKSKQTIIPTEQVGQQPTNPLMMLLQHKQLIQELQQEIQELKDSKQKNMNNPNDVEYFKKQYESLLTEFNEIKKVLVKVQTFSMETNLEILLLKKLLKSHNIEIPSTNNAINEQELSTIEENN
jgi:hypothetical protein